MNALILIQHILDRSFAYVAACWSLSWSATECLALWSWVALGSVATGTLLLLWSIWKAMANSRKHRAARREEIYRQQIALEETMKKSERTEEARFWDGPDRRTVQDRRKIAPEETMKNPMWMGDAEMRDELDRRTRPDRRKTPRPQS